MPTMLIEFEDDDATPDRLDNLARETGLSPEELVHRAIAQYLGEHGLKPLPEDFKPQALQELFLQSGVLKPK